MIYVDQLATSPMMDISPSRWRLCASPQSSSSSKLGSRPWDTHTHCRCPIHQKDPFFLLDTLPSCFGHVSETESCLKDLLVSMPYAIVQEISLLPHFTSILVHITNCIYPWTCLYPFANVVHCCDAYTVCPFSPHYVGFIPIPKDKVHALDWCT